MSTRYSGFLVQSNWGVRGNFEVVTPLEAGGFAHIWRNNDAGALPWSAPYYFGAGFADDVALIQSSYDSPGNLDMVARYGDRLVHIYRSKDLKWHETGQLASGVSGTPALIESTFGMNAGPHGNFELVAPVATGGLAHWWRDNSVPGGVWHGPAYFGTGTVSAVALFQSNYGSPGNLEVIARVGSQLVHYWRDRTNQWHAPTAPFASGVMGTPAAIQSTFGSQGNFEVVAACGSGGLAHWLRDNDNRQTWHGPTPFGSAAVDAVALIQGNFTDGGSSPGHLEVVTRSGRRLDHWWRESGGAFRWFNPIRAFEEVPCVPNVAGDCKLPYESEIVGIHTALVHTGKLLLFAFADTDDGMGVSRVLEPKSGAISTPVTPANAFCSGHSHLADGRLLVVGGHHHPQDIAGLRTFDPESEKWQGIGTMPHGRWYPTCTTLPDGRVFIISGTLGNGGPVDQSNPLGSVNNTVQIFDPQNNVMGPEQHIPVPFSVVDNFEPVDLYPFCYVLPSGKVMVHSRRTTRFYDPATQSWDGTQVYANYPWTRSYPGGGTSVLLPLSPTTKPPYRARVLIAGGGGADPRTLDVHTPATATAEILDLSAPTLTWRQLATSMLSSRIMPDAVLLPDGTVLIAGGSKSGRADHMLEPVYQLELFDPAAETWTPMCSIHVPRLYHSTAILLPDARILMAGRSGLFQDSPYDYAEHRVEIFSPPYLFRGPRPVIASAPSSAAYGATITIGTPQASSVSAVAVIRTGAVTHAFNMDQRYVALSITGRAGNNLTVQTPPDGKAAPPGYYLLFVLRNGVPSVATFIRLG